MNCQVLFALVAALSLGVGAFARAETPSDTIIIGKHTHISSARPRQDYEFSGMQIGSNLYDRLLRYEAEDLTKLVGGVAQSWTVSPDGKVFTFKIRPNSAFQNGDPLSADDVAFSLRRVIKLAEDAGVPVVATRLDASKRRRIGHGDRAGHGAVHDPGRPPLRSC